MSESVNALLIWEANTLLTLLRIGAFFIISPIFGRANIPNTVKILLSVMFTLIVVNMTPVPAELPAQTIMGYGALCVGEIIVGLIIGFMTTMFFSVAFTAGQIIDTQLGFGMVQMFDPSTNVQIPIAGSLLNLILLISVLLAGGHIKLIEYLFRTFTIVPAGRALFSPDIARVVIEAFIESFNLAVRISIPLIAASLITEIGLGVVVRTAPQMNVFVIGIPIKALVGLIVFFLIIPVFAGFTSLIFDGMYGYLGRALGEVGAA